MKNLSIPKRDRLKGQNIRCSICYGKGKGFCSSKDKDGNKKWMCKGNGKLISSCPNPLSQKYVSILYNPFSKKSDIVIPHKTRDFLGFRKKHVELLEIETEIKHLISIGKTEHAMAIIENFKSKPSKKKDDQSKGIEAKAVNVTGDTYLETAIYIYNAFLNGEKGEIWEKRPSSKKCIQNYQRALERFHECLVNNSYNPQIMPLSSLSKKHLNCWVREVFD